MKKVSVFKHVIVSIAVSAACGTAMSAQIQADSANFQTLQASRAGALGSIGSGYNASGSIGSGYNASGSIGSGY
ncbi:hypothetical protein EON82_22185, partial [bacterium]